MQNLVENLDLNYDLDSENLSIIPGSDDLTNFIYTYAPRPSTIRGNQISFKPHVISLENLENQFDGYKIFKFNTQRIINTSVSHASESKKQIVYEDVVEESELVENQMEYSNLQCKTDNLKMLISPVSSTMSWKSEDNQKFPHFEMRALKSFDSDQDSQLTINENDLVPRTIYGKELEEEMVKLEIRSTKKRNFFTKKMGKLANAIVNSSGILKGKSREPNTVHREDLSTFSSRDCLKLQSKSNLDGSHAEAFREHLAMRRAQRNETL